MINFYLSFWVFSHSSCCDVMRYLILTILYLCLTTSLCLLPGFKCPVCSKSVASNEMEVHFIMCLSKPRLSYNGKHLCPFFHMILQSMQNNGSTQAEEDRRVWESIHDGNDSHDCSESFLCSLHIVHHAYLWAWLL